MLPDDSFHLSRGRNDAHNQIFFLLPFISRCYILPPNFRVVFLGDSRLSLGLRFHARNGGGETELVANFEVEEVRRQLVVGDFYIDFAGRADFSDLLDL